MLNDVVDLIIRANLALGAAILLVLALRAPVRRVFGARVAYGLWLTPVLAVLVACFAPARTITVAAQPTLDRPAPVQEAIETSARLGVTAPPPELIEKLVNLDFALVAVGVWIVGALLALLLLAARQLRFLRAMGRVSPLGDNVFRSESEKAGPAVVGVLRPRIITPRDFDARFDEAERDVVLAHERAHLAQRDPWINAAAALARCVAWFNPLVHVAERALRFDQELSCDAAVLGARTGARRRYAAAMLKSHAPTLTAPLGCAWPGRDFKPMKERIIMLKQALPTRTRMLIGASVVSLAVMGAASVAWSARPTEVRVADRGADVVSEHDVRVERINTEDGGRYEVLLGGDDVFDAEEMERMIAEISETAGEEAAREFEAHMEEYQAQLEAFEAQAEQFAQYEPPEPPELAELAELPELAEMPEPPEPPEIADVDVRIHGGPHVRINPPSREEIARIREQAERMAEQHQRMAEQHRLSAEQRREFQEQARAAAREHQEQARAAAEEARAQVQSQMVELRAQRQALAQQERDLARARAQLERDLARLEGAPVIIDRDVRIEPGRPVRIEREERVIRRGQPPQPAQPAQPGRPAMPPPEPSEDGE